MPGVVAAAGAFTLPIGGDDFGASAFPEGRPLPAPGADRRIGFQIVGDQWFRTLGMQLREGRDFSSIDKRESTQVVIINQALADSEWPGQSPIGLRLRYAREADAPWLTVVGVVSNIHHLGPSVPARPEIYLPYSQMSQAMMAVAVRTTGDPLSLVPAIRAAAAEVDPTQPISGVNTMEAHLTRALWTRAVPDDLDDVVWSGDVSADGGRRVCRHEFRRRAANEGVRRARGAGRKSGAARP